MELNSIHENPKNPRTISKHKFEKLKASIKRRPKFMRDNPMKVDENGMLLGGNMRYRALIDLGYTEVPDEWVKVIEDYDDAEKDEFVIIDNLAFGEWDWDIMANDYSFEQLTEMGVDVPNMDREETYSRKIESPHYKPIGLEPEVDDLTDQTKYVELMEAIDESKASEEVKAFLRLAATRHIVFNYRWIADYYATAGKEVQELMEQSALVVIDFENAIEGGFVELTERLNSIFDAGHGEA